MSLSDRGGARATRGAGDDASPRPGDAAAPRAGDDDAPRRAEAAAAPRAGGADAGAAHRAGDGRAAYRTGLLLLLVTATGWGLNWPIMKFLLSEVPPLTARGGPGVLGAALAFALAARAGEAAWPTRAQLPRLLLAALLNYTAWMGLATLGLLWLPAGEAAIAAYTMPLWTTVFAWPLLGERPTRRRVAGLLLGLAGVAVLVGARPPSASLAALPGVACVLGAAVLFALGAVLAKRLPLGLPPLAGTAWQVALGTAPLLLAAALFERPDVARVSAAGWAGLAYGGVFALGLAYIAWFGALRRLPASTAAVGTLLVPVVGVFGAAVLLGEPLGWRQAVALAMTLAGVALAVRDRG